MVPAVKRLRYHNNGNSRLPLFVPRILLNGPWKKMLGAGKHDGLAEHSRLELNCLSATHPEWGDDSIPIRGHAAYVFHNTR